MNLLFRKTPTQLIGFAASIVLFTTSANAIQPLSEQAMGDVSFDSGIEIVNIYGPTSAGLEDDVKIETSKPENSDKEIETANSSAKQIIDDSESELSEPIGDANSEEDLTFAQIESAIAEGVSTVGTANFLETNSEIRYQNGAFLRDAEFFNDGAIRQTRDLYIDQLKFENIRGDEQDNNRSVGDLYLSDWQSRGSTQITVD